MFIFISLRYVQLILKPKVYVVLKYFDVGHSRFSCFRCWVFSRFCRLRFCISKLGNFLRWVSIDFYDIVVRGRAEYSDTADEVFDSHEKLNHKEIIYVK